MIEYRVSENLLKIKFYNSRRYVKFFIISIISLFIATYYVNISTFICIRSKNNLGLCQLNVYKAIGSYQQSFKLNNIHSAHIEKRVDPQGENLKYQLVLATYDGYYPLSSRLDQNNSEYVNFSNQINNFVHNNNIKSLTISIPDYQWWLLLSIGMWIVGIIILIHSTDQYCYINKDFNAFLFLSRSLVKRKIKEYKISELTNIEIEEEIRSGNQDKYYVYRICFIFFQFRYFYPLDKFKPGIYEELSTIKAIISSFIEYYEIPNVQEDSQTEQ